MCAELYIQFDQFGYSMNKNLINDEYRVTNK